MSWISRELVEKSAVIAVAITLSSCGNGNSSNDDYDLNEKLSDLNSISYEASSSSYNKVQHKSNIVTYDSVIVKKRGNIKVYDRTIFCNMPSDVDPILKEKGVKGIALDGDNIAGLLKSFGQSTNVNGSVRMGSYDVAHCSENGINIVTFGHVLLNRTGSPYRLSLVAKQGSAFWEGSIERRYGRRPGSNIPERPSNIGDGPCCEPEYSIELDARAISKNFLEQLQRGEK